MSCSGAFDFNYDPSILQYSNYNPNAANHMGQFFGLPEANINVGITTNDNGGIGTLGVAWASSSLQEASMVGTYMYIAFEVIGEGTSELTWNSADSLNTDEMSFDGCNTGDGLSGQIIGDEYFTNGNVSIGSQDMCPDDEEEDPCSDYPEACCIKCASNPDMPDTDSCYPYCQCCPQELVEPTGYNCRRGHVDGTSKCVPCGPNGPCEFESEQECIKSGCETTTNDSYLLEPKKQKVDKRLKEQTDPDTWYDDWVDCQAFSNMADWEQVAICGEYMEFVDGPGTQSTGQTDPGGDPAGNYTQETLDYFAGITNNGECCTDWCTEMNFNEGCCRKCGDPDISEDDPCYESCNFEGLSTHNFWIEYGH